MPRRIKNYVTEIDYLHVEFFEQDRKIKYIFTSYYTYEANVSKSKGS